LNHSKQFAIAILLVLAALVLAACAGLGGPRTATPTITAIPLPTRTPTQVAESRTTAPSQAASPTPSATPTATPSPEATTTLSLQATRTPSPTATSLPPTPTPEATATEPPTPTEKPRPTAPRPTAVATRRPTEIAPTPTPSRAGTGPDDALVPASGWQQLGVGQSRWYAFQYLGDRSQVRVQMQVQPAGSAGFAVWTPRDAQQWRLGLQVEPVGRGSVDPSVQGNLVWSGSFDIAGTYYVVVEHSGNQPGRSYYLLQISGSSVSLSLPTPAATATRQPAGPRPQSNAPFEPTGKLAFETTVGGEIYVINADGTGLRRLTSGIDPVWSPSGRQIAFSRWQEPRGVWVIDADGSGERRVFDWTETRWPSWSPDGSQIVFSRQHGGETEDVQRCFFGHCFTIPANPNWELGIVRLADGSFREPASPQYSPARRAPSWSPTGERLVYADVHGLKVQSLDGSVSYDITSEGRDTSPTWSPDGNRVAFVRRQHDHWEIYAVNGDSTGLSRLTTTPSRPDGTPGNSVSPAWSPAPPQGGPGGPYIAFLTDRTGKWEIWVMRADGSDQQPLFRSALDGLALEYAFDAERAISWTQ
jgi:TolB protein